MTHSFNIQIAKQYGLHEAIMISNFQYWISKNLANRNHHHDGRTWTYNSVRAFEELFPYLTSWQIRKSLESLVEQGVLLKGNYHKNPYERSCWYAFANESLFLDSQNHLCSTSNGNDEDIKSITDNKPNSKPIIRKETIKHEIKFQEPIHPLQQWVRENCLRVSKLKKQLTFDEAQKIASEFNIDLIHAKLLAMENKAKLDYVSVNLTLRNWLSKEQMNPSIPSFSNYQTEPIKNPRSRP